MKRAARRHPDRDRLGKLLIAAGMVCAAWPALGWSYGLLSQDRLAAEMPVDTSSRPPVLVPITTTTPTPAPTPASARRRLIARAATPKTAGAKAEPKRVAAVAPAERRAKRRRAAVRAVPGHAFARLRIDRIGLDTVVVEGADNRSLRRGPGHLPETGLPGETGNCAIAAHRDAWFRRLPEVRVGDPVLVRTRDGAAYEYVVEAKRVVTPDRGDLLNRGPRPRLTLITCTGPGYPRSKYRLLVFCRLRAASPGALLTAAAR